MTELLSMEEIKERYRDEWVLVVDVESDPGSVCRRARVAWHGDSQKEGWQRSQRCRVWLHQRALDGRF